jgi:CheY-like chemotaxis protein/DNA-binding CsgD family transcriptional regulator
VSVEASVEPTRRVILVVDDSPANLRLLDAVLAPTGHEVRFAESGPEALTRVAESVPDLVLLDVLMPGMSGYEVCRRLRADPATRALPIILITASEQQEKLTALEVGADDFVQKSFDRVELLARVRSLLRIKEANDTIRAQATELAELNRTLEARIAAQVEEIGRLNRLRRFFSPQLADAIMAAGDHDLLESHRAKIAILFADLRGFTAFSELAEPEETLTVLGEFREAAGECVHRFGATLGLFAGDGLMAFLNDPLPCPEPAWRAVSLALALREAVRERAHGWRRRGYELGLGVGVGLGYATLGMTGFRGRWDYGPTGPVVNLASRLCDAAHDDQILLSRPAHADVADRVDGAALEDLVLKGFRDPVSAFLLSGLRDGEAGEALTPHEVEVLRLVTEGVSNRGIGQRLHVSEGTAARQVASILTKLGARNRAEATQIAVRRRLLEPAPKDP